VTDELIKIVQYIETRTSIVLTTTMDQTHSQATITPHTQSPLVTRTYPSDVELDAVIHNAAKAQKEWGRVPVKERIEIGRKFMVSIPRCTG
jgi:acyl-CoA reductase-like NAD-dependent aldehyde dehydrogenase